MDDTQRNLTRRERQIMDVVYARGRASVAEVLEGLGFSTADLQRPYNEFSGGWRMRVLLAKMMLQAPDVVSDIKRVFAEGK